MSQINFFVKYILKILPRLINAIFVKKNDSIFVITNNIAIIAKILKLNSFFKLTCLNDICVVDNPNYLQRFEICYNFLSVQKNTRFFIKTYVATQLSSLTFLYNSAN
jgi:NADH:ubiquinone oxidoreductase subunit C